MMESVDRHVWETVAQPFELEWWQTRCKGPKDRELFCKRSEAMWNGLGISLDFFADGLTIDVGCGPTGRLEALQGRFVAIEPLADELRMLPCSYFDKYEKVFAFPVEDKIEELVCSASHVISINALDHAFDFRLAIHNIREYLLPPGNAFISFDCCLDRNDDTHPIDVNPERASELYRDAGFRISSHWSGGCFGLLAWGSGIAHHWLLEIDQ